MPDRNKSYLLKELTRTLDESDSTAAFCLCQRWVLKDASAILKEQEAVEPTNSYGTFRCGNCRNIVGYNDGLGCGYQNNFCSNCGKAVKWE